MILLALLYRVDSFFGTVFLLVPLLTLDSVVSKLARLQSSQGAA